MPPGDLRGQVAAVLEDLNAPGGPLGTESPHATFRRHLLSGTDPHHGRYTADRVRLHASLVERHRARQVDVARDGFAAVVTAGPPGAGKSTFLDALDYGPQWRRIDADDFKTLLIEHDLDSLLPDDLVDLDLADGLPLMPLELSGLYHHESTRVADLARERALDAHENVVIEGTLSWGGQGRALLSDLTGHDYAHLDVVLVQPPLDVVLDQALDRWWVARQAHQSGGLGGRFTPAALIRSLYRSDGSGACSDNARHLVAEAQLAGLQATLKQ